MVHSDRSIIYNLAIRSDPIISVIETKSTEKKNAKKSQNGQRNTTVALNLNKK